MIMALYKGDYDSVYFTSPRSLSPSFSVGSIDESRKKLPFSKPSNKKSRKNASLDEGSGSRLSFVHNSRRYASLRRKYASDPEINVAPTIMITRADSDTQISSFESGREDNAKTSRRSSDEKEPANEPEADLGSTVPSKGNSLPLNKAAKSQIPSPPLDEGQRSKKGSPNERRNKVTNERTKGSLRSRRNTESQINRKSRLSSGKETGDYAITTPQGENLYENDIMDTLPPLPSQTPVVDSPRRAGKASSMSRKKGTASAKSVLYPYIHGLSRTVGSTPSSRIPSAHESKSKDDSRIQYELPFEDLKDSRNLNRPEHWKARKVRIYRNGDRYFPGVDFVFRPGRDVTHLESLCDKLSGRVGLVRGARYLFDLEGRRKLNLEDLEDGMAYVASSDRKFINLPYGRQKNSWNPTAVYAKFTDEGTNYDPYFPMNKKKNSPDSSVSSHSKPNSREGRNIKIINTVDPTQERSVLVNMKSVQAWEDMVGDLGQVLKLKGNVKLFTKEGQEVKSFSQFKKDFANVDTFHLSANPARPSTGQANGLPNGTAVNSKIREVKEKEVVRKRRTDIRRYTSEPNLKEAARDFSSLEVADGKAAMLTIRGQNRVLLAPSVSVKHDPTPPEEELELDWVFGYRGADTRQNLWVLPSGEILYFVAAVAILYNRTEESQRHYTEHTEDIMCMTIHNTQQVVASGQRASRNKKASAHVRVWSAKSLNTLHVLGMKELEVGVIAVAFSNKYDGEYLLALDSDQEHLLNVWSWENEKTLGKVATNQGHVYGAVFHPMDHNLIITYGKFMLTLWSRRKDGIFHRKDLIEQGAGRSITAVEFTKEGDLIAGDDEGKIRVWTVEENGEFGVAAEFQAHSGPISCLKMLSEGTVLSGGEKDRWVIAWDCDEDFEKVADNRLPEQAGGIRSIVPQRPGQYDGNIYVGSVRNIILEGSLQRRFNQIAFGHSKQLWGLAVNHIDGSVVTAGYDKQVVMWKGTKLEWRIQVQSECVSVACHPVGTVVAVGTIDGHMIIVNAVTGAHVTTIRICGSPISCLAYNGNGDCLAVGSQNGSLYLFKVSKNGFVHNRYGRMGSAHPLSAIDWSSSGNCIQSVTSEYDVVYWNVKELNKAKNPVDSRDEEWDTQTCSVSYMVHGIWTGRRDSPLHISVDRSPNGNLLVAGDTDGFLRLFSTTEDVRKLKEA